MQRLLRGRVLYIGLGVLVVFLYARVLTLLLVSMGVAGVFLTIKSLWTGEIYLLWRFRPRRLPPWSFGEFWRILLLILLLASLMPFVRLVLLSLVPQIELDHHLWLILSMVCLDTVLVLTVLSFAVEKNQRDQLRKRTAASKAIASIEVNCGS